jgi:hypothetical protein
MVDPMMMTPMMMDPMQNLKKTQNLTNYKIVKCKNFENGKIKFIQMEYANMEILVHSLMVRLN